MAVSLTNKQYPPCPACKATYVIKKGRRRNRLRTTPLFQCNECGHRFIGEAGKHKTYPLKTILEAVSTFNLGHSLTDTQRILRHRAHVDIPERTTRSWLSAYKMLATYRRWRSAGKKLFRPSELIRSMTLEHQQVYRFQIHQAKLELLLQPGTERQFAPLREYLKGIGHDFPHRLFQSSEHRSSKFPTQLQPPIVRKENHATRLAALALPIAPMNKRRHETLQRFMLINDSVTVAVEIPVYLTRQDIAYYRDRGFTLPFDSDIITGHIDFLQVRNGHLHILDYKPEARREKHAHVQLTIYALALSRRLNLPLRHFKCAWFDERDYFEFFPLQAVYWPKAQL
jgi:ATP-dependent exoDNAse (exonuclease V) beta subunit